MTEKKPDLKSMTREEVEAFAEAAGEKRYRGRQLYEWMHAHQAASFDEMKNLPEAWKRRLSETCEYTVLTPLRRQVSAEDGTKKYLFALADGHVVETVFMPYRFGNSVCVSSQVGCRMGCRFCASAIGGWERDLTPAEILEQVYAVERENGKISHVVVMGTGEPLDNYDSLVRFVRLLSDENGRHLSQRNITVSTCGLVPQIKKLAQEGLQITLALSLHAPDQKKRLELMPVANRYDIHEAVEACLAYAKDTGRRVTFEYSLIEGVNDSGEDAEQLALLLKGSGGHVNLIPVNPVAERTFRRSRRAAVEAFKNKLEKNGINVTIRREMGRDIDGACGQLRRRHISETREG